MTITGKLRIGLFALGIAASHSYAADSGSWISSTSGCMVFQAGQATKDLSVSWTGKCSDGYAEGKGTLTWSNGNRYEGEVSVGMINGKGTFYWANGDWYQGGFKQGLREGFGTQHYACSGEYHGQFHNGVMDGLGVLDLANGNRYAGYFRRGMMHGLGVRDFANGTRYEGEFENNHEEGLGTLSLPNLARYQGEFKNDQPDGHALVTDPGGNVYEGTYADGHVDGLGILTKPNGERDVGTFKDHKGTVKLVSNLGPALYEPCQTHCSTTTTSCGTNTVGAINPDDPNYQMKLMDAQVTCGREMQQCVSVCERHNPTVRDLKGIVEIGELDQPVDNSKPASGSTHDAKAASEAKPAADFADQQAAATSALRARLEDLHQQLKILQVNISTLPHAAVLTAPVTDKCD